MALTLREDVPMSVVLLPVPEVPLRVEPVSRPGVRRRVPLAVLAAGATFRLPAGRPGVSAFSSSI